MKNEFLKVISIQKSLVRNIICLLSLLLTSYSSLLAQPTFTTKVSAPKVGRNQNFEVSFEMSNVNNIDAFSAPRFPGFSVVGGPMQSSYNSSVNGVSSSRSVISFYLKPTKTGRLTISGAHATLDGKPMISNTTTVEVEDKNVDQPADNSATDPSFNPFNDPFFSNGPQAAPPPSEDRSFAKAHTLHPGESIQKKIDDNLFIKVFTNKTTVYEGEPIVATYKVYSRLDMTAGVTKRPSFSGFSAFDMEEPSQSGVPETLNGQNYMCYTIRKVQLYPLQSGSLTLESVEVDCDIRFIKSDNAMLPNFDPNDTANQKQLHYVLKNEPITITALPFPDKKKPADFKGAVGNFTISAVTTATEIGKDDAEKVQVTISGNGNFSMVQSPDVAWPKSIEAYDPKQKDNLDQTVSPTSGAKMFEYVFICHKPGRDTIPPIHFSYFDVASKSYKTISTDPIFLKILPQSKHPQKALANEGHNFPALFTGVAKYVLPISAVVLSALLFLAFQNKKKKQLLQTQQEEKKARKEAWEKLVAETKSKRQPVNAPISNTSAPLSTTAAETIPANKHESYMPVGFSNPPVPETVEDKPIITEDIRLPESNLLLWLGDDKTFFQALKKDILQELKIKSKAPNTNKHELFLLLKSQGRDETVLQQLKSIVDECDALVYSPLQTPPDRNRTMDEAKYLLGKL